MIRLIYKKKQKKIVNTAKWLENKFSRLIKCHILQPHSRRTR